ncbi:CBASS oligonucleotide cyclase [Burkholderia cepacia]|uniref:CBASS oligonucleotide cyclase n=1 Tax=Burkholderia cepacia TaxID=292 RepID=UPI001CF4473D|nr:CBASS oligonucleotide cyclase [Burkholderia cepacia]MCA8318603.1 nucleotidyltransferase [Burkholderia cepacia]
MGKEHVGHSDIACFADERVNLKRDDAKELRRQGNLLKEKLESYLSDHDHFELRKLMLSGSLAKGTALKSGSDLDIACYVSSDSAPDEIDELIKWLAKRLETAFANFSADQIQPKTYSVGVTFKGTGNEFDIVPILYDDDPQWRGYLVSQDDGEKLLTSVPMHLEFIRSRKEKNNTHLAQVIRLIKYWAKLHKQEDDDFRFKSFMIEMIVCKLADRGLVLSDYVEALAGFFNYIVTDEFRTTISFDDYYNPTNCAATSDPIRIWDPVNCENNVAKLYTEQNRQKLLDAAMDAADAIDSALYANTKGDTVRYWQKIFGPNFSA